MGADPHATQDRAAKWRGVPVMVSGSRGWTDREAIRREFLAWWNIVYGYGPEQVPPMRHAVELIHGDALGADRMAASVAEELGWFVRPFPADWKRHGKRAGVLRNQEMLDMNPAHVFIFWDGESRGTKYVIDYVQSHPMSYSIEKAA